MAMAASATLRSRVASVPMKLSLTICWVMVDPPCREPPPMFSMNALRHGPVVDAVVVHEVGVLGRQHRSDHQIGDLVERDRLAVALVEFAQQHPVGGVDLGQAADVGEVQHQRFHIGDPLVADVSRRCPRRWSR